MHFGKLRPRLISRSLSCLADALEAEFCCVLKGGKKSCRPSQRAHTGSNTDRLALNRLVLSRFARDCFKSKKLSQIEKLCRIPAGGVCTHRPPLIRTEQPERVELRSPLPGKKVHETKWLPID
jgi:hypothetical protein